MNNRPAADFINQTKKLFGNYVFSQSINADPIVDEYTLNDTGKMYVVYIPDEKGRTGVYTLNLGNADSAYIYSPAVGASDMTITRLKVNNGNIIVNATETPVFVKPVGISNYNPPSASGIHLFPNPAHHNITIQGLQNGQQQQLTVFNSDGKRVSRSVTTSNTFQINTVALPNGVYFLEIRNANEKQTLRFIKRN